MSTRLSFQQLLSPFKLLFPSFAQLGLTSHLTAFFVLIFAVSDPALSATIHRTFIGGDRPIGSSGSGNLISIFDTAATYWESAIQDDFGFSIDFGWESLPETTLAEFTSLSTTADPQRTSEGLILFNSSTELFDWFLDGTPDKNEEFQTFTTFSDDFGSGTINTGRVYSDPAAAAEGRFDLLTIAVHELGHAFGIFNFYEIFDEETFDDDDIDVQEPFPFAGSELPTTPINGGHLDIETAAMAAFFEPGTRTLLSEADILGAAISSGSQQLNFNPQPNLTPSQQTPEPANLLGMALLAGVVGARRLRSQPSCAS